MPYHSQFGEDRWLAENTFNGSLVESRPFHFCEVGALDGVQSSNTLHFEEDLGWWELCLEPQPRLARQCRENRDCMVFDFAVSLKKGPVNFFIHPSDQGQSGMLAEGMMIQVHSDRLDHILESLCFVSLDLLSIDVEGTELEVWESIGAFRPRVVIMEYLSGDKVDRSSAIMKRMTLDGYGMIHRTEANLIFEFQ